MKMRNLIFFFLLGILSIANLSSSQSNPPLNIETFYPFADSPSPGQFAPAPTQGNGIGVQFPTPAPSPSGSSRKAIMTAVGATAASTFVLAAVFFLVFAWARSRKGAGAGTGNGARTTPALPPAVVRAGSRSEYKRFGGNVKGYIIDEDGLDVLYWKKLSNSGGFKKEPYNSAGNANGKRIAVPRGRSSSSQTQIHLRQGSGGGGDQKTLSSMAIPKSPPPPEKKVELVPPPPPPAPVKKNPPPPPPNSKPPAAPPPSKTVESVARGEASGSGSDDQVKLKPLHWEKLNVKPDQSMVWDKIDKGSFQYNGDMMEALFGVVATNRRSPKPQSSTDINGGGSSNSNPQIFILDPRRSQNIAIVIKSLGIPRESLIESLIDGKGLTSETLEKLTRAAITKEEESGILAFNGDPSKLADAESFLYHLLKSIPSAFARVDELLFRSSYDSEISSIKESLQTLESACNELRNRGIFMKLLEAILKAGNRLNAGTSRGDAKAFNLTTLRKLSDYKSSDGKTTLLHFVVHEVVRNEGRRCVLARSNSIGRSIANASSDDPTTKEVREREFLKLGLPVVGGLSSEFSSVKNAASIDYDALKGTLSSLERRVMGDGFKASSDGGGEFFEAAEAEIKEVQEEHDRVMSLVKSTTKYYQAGASNDKIPLLLFVIVKDFLSHVDQTCVEIARSLQQKKQVTTSGGGTGSGSGSGSSSGPGSPQQDVLRSRVTFPRLPEHFLSDKSSNGSDEDS